MQQSNARQTFNLLCQSHSVSPTIEYSRYGDKWKVILTIKLSGQQLVVESVGRRKSDAKEEACKLVLDKLSSDEPVVADEKVQEVHGGFKHPTQPTSIKPRSFAHHRSDWNIVVGLPRKFDMAPSGAIGLDCEWVLGLKPSEGMVCYQLAFTPEMVVYVVSPDEIVAFKPYLESEHRDIYLFHTATNIYNTPEGKGLRRYDIRPRNVINIARHRLPRLLGIHPNTSLQTLTRSFLNYELDKTMQTHFTVETKLIMLSGQCDEHTDWVRYAAMDAIVVVVLGEIFNSIYSLVSE